MGFESHFFLSKGRAFMCRDGPAAGQEHCNKKLCFTATDKDFLVELLDELSRDEDCHFVKYSIEPRDRMYLGRCFLRTEERVGALWQRFKDHPKVMCSIQDDDFTARFRDRGS